MCTHTLHDIKDTRGQSALVSLLWETALTWEERDSVRVSPEHDDVLLDPAQGQHLVQQPRVTPHLQAADILMGSFTQSITQLGGRLSPSP